MRLWMLGYLFSNRGIGTDKTVVWYEDDSGVRASRGFGFVNIWAIPMCACWMGDAMRGRPWAMS